MNFEFNTNLLFLVPAITGTVEIVKKSVPSVASRGWATLVLSAILGIGSGYLFGPDDFKSSLTTGVILWLMSNGLYDYAKPIGQKIAK
jgi:hypothetical protein